MYVAPLQQLSNVFFVINHSQATTHLKQQITANHINTLHFCSNLLDSNNINEKVVESDKFDDLLEDISELNRKILELELDTELKNFLVSCINDLENSIRYYNINGSESFKRFIKNSIGDFYLNKERINNPSNSEETKGILIKLFHFIDKANKLVNFARNTQIALPYITDFISKNST